MQVAPRNRTGALITRKACQMLRLAGLMEQHQNCAGCHRKLYVGHVAYIADAFTPNLCLNLTQQRKKV